jgi:hypothetical protein
MPIHGLDGERTGCRSFRISIDEYGMDVLDDEIEFVDPVAAADAERLPHHP